MQRDLSSIELRYLTALMAVSREGSFSRAAEQLGYTQSAVSQQIARLERSVGHQLVERPGGPRPVSLTSAGTVLLRHAEAIVARLSSAAADLDALDAGTAGSLRIGCFQSVGVHMLPRIVREFSTQFPGVQVELMENEDDGELLRQVERGDLDLTFVVAPIPAGPFDWEELLADPYVVVVPEESAAAQRGTAVTLDELSEQRLISYTQVRTEHLVENRLGRPGLRDRIVFHSNDNGVLMGMAAEGVGVAVVPWLAAGVDRPGLRVLPIADTAPRTVGIAWHQDRYQLAASHAFIDLAQQAGRYEEARMRRALGEEDAAHGVGD
ncbi:MAG: LysR family transcriptional regulator [Gordonia sp. (in: high G+C Gram-positive bacteria)]|uniref:LysR family transcriptional regulator n=1 Tax=Gordonia sp. (in: high G+C Gram-positive bacteria) TaxID=84139 RepID=UPI003C7637EA